VWINDTCGHQFMSSPHGQIIGGVAPHEYLAVDADRLVVACGRSTPAIFDKQSGALLHLDSEGDFTGGALTMIANDLVFMQADTLIKEYGNIRNQPEPEDRFAEHEIFELATLVAKDDTTGREVLLVGIPFRALPRPSHHWAGVEGGPVIRIELISCAERGCQGNLRLERYRVAATYSSS